MKSIFSKLPPLLPPRPKKTRKGSFKQKKVTSLEKKSLVRTMGELFETKSLSGPPPEDDFVVVLTSPEATANTTTPEATTCDARDSPEAETEASKDSAFLTNKSCRLFEDTGCAIREVGRLLFFTDVPNNNKHSNVVGRKRADWEMVAPESSTSKEPSSTLEAFKASVEHTLSECQRTVLFTDLDERASDEILQFRNERIASF